MSSRRSEPDKRAESIDIPLPSTAAHNLLLLHSICRQSDIEWTTNPPTPQESRPAVDGSAELIPSARHVKLQQSISSLEEQITAKREQLKQNLEILRQHDATIELENDETTLHKARQIVSRHIKLLHQYNEIKDIGLGLLGMIADKEGKRLGDVMKERAVDDKD